MRTLLRSIVLLGAALASACDRSPTESPAGIVHLSFWNGFSGPDGAAMESLVKRFNQEHEGIQVKMQIIPWNAYYDKLTLSLAFGGAPDVLVLHASRVPEYASHGVLAEQDALIADSKLTLGDFVSKTLEAGLWQGKRVGLPLDCHPLGMYYNLDLLEQAGINNPPSTGEEFISAAKAIQARNPGVWGFAFTDLHLIGSTFFYQFGGGLLTPDLTRSSLGASESLEAVHAMQRLIEEDKICPPPGGTDGWLGFMGGKVAMVFHGIWMIDSLQKQDSIRYAAAPIPIFGPKKSVWAGSHCLCIPASLPEREKKAAWTFIKYLSDNSLEWAKGGQVPVRTSVLDSPEFRALPVQREFAKQLPFVQFEPFSVAANQISSFADAAVEAALSGGENPAQALKKAAERVENVLKRQ